VRDIKRKEILDITEESLNSTPLSTTILPTLQAINNNYIEEFHCNFDEDFCGMTQDKSNDHKFYLRRGKPSCVEKTKTGDPTKRGMYGKSENVIDFINK